MNRFTRWRNNRRTRHETAVLAAIAKLRPEEASGWPIGLLAGLGGGVYGVLARLEARGVVTSEWREGPYPRRRVYRITDRGGQ